MTKQSCCHLSESNGVSPPLPNRTSRWSAMNEYIHHLARVCSTCQVGSTVEFPNRFCPSMVAISPPSLSRIRPFVWPAPWATIFCKGLRNRTWHVLVQLIGPKPISSSFRPFGASNEYSLVPIRPAVRAPEAKMLGQTGRQTHKHRPTTNFFFSSGPPEEIFEQRPSMTKHWVLRH